jgi:hypothetical protein
MGGRPPANAALRGGALIVITVLVGLALLSRGFADEGGIVAPPSDGTTPTSADDNGDNGATDPDPDDGVTETDEPGEVVLPARERNEVTPLVLNGSGINGAASRVRDSLLALNYTPRSPDNTPQRVPDTAIYYEEGWRAEALVLADDLSVDPSIVQVMPVPAPHGAELGAATILVILGEDQLIAAAAG